MSRKKILSAVVLSGTKIWSVRQIGEAVELCACFHTAAHELRLVYHPEAIVVEQSPGLDLLQQQRHLGELGIQLQGAGGGILRLTPLAQLRMDVPSGLMRFRVFWG